MAGERAQGTPFEFREKLIEDQPIGAALSEISIAIEEWNGLVLSARDEADGRKARILEQTIRRRVREEYPNIVDQLATGPLVNRRIAAAALGFSDDERSLAALLAALDDPNLEVQSNALLGLGQLGRADTPIAPLIAKLRDSFDESVRSHAARALQKVLEAGASREAVREAAGPTIRRALSDTSPEVRSYAALMTARLMDTESLDVLKLLIYDEVPIAALAAARSIAFIGDQDDHLFGECARALTGALDRVDDDIRGRLLIYLQQMSRKNWGRDAEPWIEWAAKQP